jgi:hypothetical protein
VPATGRNFEPSFQVKKIHEETKGGWDWSISTLWGLTSQPQHPYSTLPPTSLLPSGYPATLQPSRTGPLGIDHPPGDNFFSTIHFRFKYFMGACSSTINYNYKSIILAQLHRIKLWGLNIISILQRKTTLQTQHNHYQHCKTTLFLLELIITCYSLILGTMF